MNAFLTGVGNLKTTEHNIMELWKNKKKTIIPVQCLFISLDVSLYIRILVEIAMLVIAKK